MFKYQSAEEVAHVHVLFFLLGGRRGSNFLLLLGLGLFLLGLHLGSLDLGGGAGSRLDFLDLVSR